MYELLNEAPTNSDAILNPANSRTSEPKLSGKKFSSQIDAERLNLHHVANGYYADESGTLVAKSIEHRGDRILVKLSDDDNDASTPYKDLPTNTSVDKVTSYAGSMSNVQNMHDLAQNPKKATYIIQQFLEQTKNRADELLPKKSIKIKDSQGNPLSFMRVNGLPIPGLLTTVQGSSDPTHIVIGSHVVPLAFRGKNKAGADISYNLSSIAKSIGREMIPATDDTPDRSAPVIRQNNNQDIIDSLMVNMESYSDPSLITTNKSRRDNWTDVKAMKLRTITDEFAQFIKHPTYQGAEYLVDTYGIRTNTTEKALILSSLESLNSTPDEKLQDFFNVQSATATPIAGLMKDPMRDAIVATIKRVLGDDFDSMVGSSVNMAANVNPTLLFSTHNINRIKITNTDNGVVINGHTFPVYFEFTDSDDNIINVITESTNIEEQLNNRYLKQLGAFDNKTPAEIAKIIQTNPPTPQHIADGQSIGKAVLIYQKRLQKLQEVNNEHSYLKWAHFNGRGDIPVMLDTLIAGFTKAAKRTRVNLTDVDLSIPPLLREFGVIPENASDAEIDIDFEQKWARLADILLDAQKDVKATAPNLCESLSLLRQMRKNKTALLPLSKNYNTIDSIFLGDNTNATKTIAELLDLPNAIGLLTTRVELLSTKSGVARGRLKDGRPSMEKQSGANPAISGLTKFTEFRADIKPEFIAFFRPTSIDPIPLEEAGRMMQTMLNDEHLFPMLCEYYNAPLDYNVLRRRMFAPTHGITATATIENKVQAVLGKIGECILNYGTKHQLYQNELYTNGGVYTTDSAKTVIGFQYIQDPKSTSFRGFNYSIKGSGSPDQMRTAQSVYTLTH